MIAISQLENLFCAAVLSSIVGCYCRIWCGHNKAVMSRSHWIISLISIFKPNLLDPNGPVSSKTLQSTISAANNKVTHACRSILQVINAPCNKGPGHMRLCSLCEAMQMDYVYCASLQISILSIYLSADSHERT